MITGVTRGAGGGALGKHLANSEHNEQVVALESRGLIATSIVEQIKELTRLGSHARTNTPIYHVHVDPPADQPWSEEEREKYWERFEAEFGFEGRPYAAVQHVKEGRTHEHRVYLRVRSNGTAIDVSHDFARIERLNREFEFERGEQITLGSHSRAVVRRLEAEGKFEVAEAMRAAGLETRSRPRALISPKERAQQERTGVLLEEMILTVLTAWRNSDSGESFRAALAVEGVYLFLGSKVPVVLDRSGAAHPLARLLAKAAKSFGADPIRAADVRTRLASLSLPDFKPGDYKQNFLAQAEFLDAIRGSVSANTPTEIEACASQEIEGNGSYNEVSEVAATFVSPEFENPLRTLSALDSGLEKDLIATQQQSQEIWNDYKRNIQTRAEALDLGRRKKHPGREGSGREEALHPGSEWFEPSELCGTESSGNGGIVNTSAGTFAASHGGGEGQDRSGHHASGTDCRGPGGLARAHARPRIQSYRFGRALTWQTYGQHHSRQRESAAGTRDGQDCGELKDGVKSSIRRVGISECRTTESKAERENRRSRWIAATVNSIYDCGWVPPSMVVNIASIKVDHEREAVILTLHSGTCLVDRLTRIDVVGRADDIAASELVAAVHRRGWQLVKLYGDEDFKRAVAAELGKLEPPIRVQADPPVREENITAYCPGL